jgi:hypothetical protein
VHRNRQQVLAIAVGVTALIGYEIYALFFAQVGAPASQRGFTEPLARELAADTRISQTFRMEADGLTAVEIWAVPSDPYTVRGDVIFELREVESREVERPILRLVRKARDVVAAPSYRVSFPPIDPSSGRVYRFELLAANVRKGRGIRLLASNEQRYVGGALFIGVREQWGDLKFRTFAVRATLFRRVEHALREAPAAARSRWTLAALLALSNWALVTFLYHMVFAPETD